MTDLIKSDDALSPCPFCGGEPTISASLVDQVSCENHSCPADVVSFDGFSTIEAAIAAWNTRAPLDLETCGKCMGSGYGGHPDSGALCFDCNGTGGVTATDPAAIREAALREAYEVVYKWWFGDGNALPQELILALIGEKK